MELDQVVQIGNICGKCGSPMVSATHKVNAVSPKVRIRTCQICHDPEVTNHNAGPDSDPARDGE